MTRGRRLTEDERALWRGVARTVRPLRRNAVADHDDGEPAKSKPRGQIPLAAPAPVPIVRAKKSPPPLAPLERRTKQKLARRSGAIDARLDLHGMTQAEAHAALTRFLHRAQANGAKFVIVVTGKGGRDSDLSERGVLRRHVPQWLRLPEFREFVVGFSAAHAAHGGEGALYVQVRRGKTP